jgi:hypothetical protein
MRVLLLLMFLLVGCATNPVNNEDLTGAVKYKYSDATNQFDRQALHNQSMRALDRSIRVMRNISNRGF